jgi:hypothetical protein
MTIRIRIRHHCNRFAGVAAAVIALVGAAGAGAARDAPRCSAAALSAKLPAQKLPAAVSSMRTRIVRAAIRCDYAALERLARERGHSFEFSFGAGRSPAAYWRRLEQTRQDDPLAKLVKIMRLPFTRDSTGLYAWPSAYRLKPSNADWNALLGIYTRAQIRQMRRAGIGYSGYRAAITRSGDWRFFIAGD